MVNSLILIHKNDVNDHKVTVANPQHGSIEGIKSEHRQFCITKSLMTHKQMIISVKSRLTTFFLPFSKYLSLFKCFFYRIFL